MCFHNMYNLDLEICALYVFQESLLMKQSFNLTVLAKISGGRMKRVPEVLTYEDYKWSWNSPVSDLTHRVIWWYIGAKAVPTLKHIVGWAVHCGAAGWDNTHSLPKGIYVRPGRAELICIRIHPNHSLGPAAQRYRYLRHVCMYYTSQKVPSTQYDRYLYITKTSSHMQLISYALPLPDLWALPELGPALWLLFWRTLRVAK